VREWLSELADLGLLIEAHTVYSVKPDLLAEHTLASSFFTMRWQSGLSYEDVLGAFPNRLPDLAAAIGRLPQGLLDPHPRWRARASPCPACPGCKRRPCDLRLADSTRFNPAQKTSCSPISRPCWLTSKKGISGSLVHLPSR